MDNKIYIITMFKYTIDSKKAYTNSEGEDMVDLTEPIFNMKDTGSVTFSLYRCPADSRMRPDKVAISAYGSEEYAEMVMKYSGIDNPFAIDKGDILVVPSLSSVYNEVRTVELSDNKGNGSLELVQNYHKYIDKSKVPDSAGSDEIEKDIYGKAEDEARANAGIPAVEPNMANKGKGGITVQNGRIYFGPNVSVASDDVTDIEGESAEESSLVDCAKKGMTVGQFLDATIKNSI